jgi:hypothetical protein
MPPSTETPVLKCDNLVVSSRGIAEAHGKKVIIFVPAAEIGRISLKFGRAEHRPIASLVFGSVLTLLGVFGLVEMFLAPKGIRYELGMVAFGVIGASLIFDALKERYFLEVSKNQAIRRLVFSKQAQLKDIREFCGQVRAIYKHDIAEDV